MNSRIAALIASAVLYLIALVCPVFKFAEGSSGFIPGFVCLLFGFSYAAWYANPLLAAGASLMLIKKDRASLVCAVAAIALGLTTLTIEEVPRDSSGQKTAVVGYLPGFYLWMTAMVVVLSASLIHVTKPHPVQQTPE